jgi:hypothetical protein
MVLVFIIYKLSEKYFYVKDSKKIYFLMLN